MKWKNPQNLYRDDENRNAIWMAQQAVGRSIFGRVYGFPKPHGPSRFECFDGDTLVFISLLTDERFAILPKELADKPELLSEVEVIAWASRG